MNEWMKEGMMEGRKNKMKAEVIRNNNNSDNND